MLVSLPLHWNLCHRCQDRAFLRLKLILKFYEKYLQIKHLGIKIN